MTIGSGWTVQFCELVMPLSGLCPHGHVENQTRESYFSSTRKDLASWGMSMHNLQRRVKGNVFHWGKKETGEDPYHCQVLISTKVTRDIVTQSLSPGLDRFKNNNSVLD
jgi:hypothetical protein